VHNVLLIDHRLDRCARRCRGVVETPQNSRSKYDYDEETGLFRLAGVLPAGMAFPLSFGFVPSTKGEDGDPLDVLFLSDEPLPVGTLVDIQLLGVIKAEQTEQGQTVRNDRLLAKVFESHTWADVQTASQLGPAFAKDLSRFFETYNDLRGRTFKMTALEGPDEACALIARQSGEST
jgi:inorganic pyrophosphatase